MYKICCISSVIVNNTVESSGRNMQNFSLLGLKKLRIRDQKVKKFTMKLARLISENETFKGVLPGSRSIPHEVVG